MKMCINTEVSTEEKSNKTNKQPPVAQNWQKTKTNKTRIKLVA